MRFKSFKHFACFHSDDIVFKTSHYAKPLHIISNKVDGYILENRMALNISNHVTLIRNTTQFSIIYILFYVKSKTPDVYFHKYINIKINSDDDLHLQKSLNKHYVVALNVIIL